MSNTIFLDDNIPADDPYRKQHTDWLDEHHSVLLSYAIENFKKDGRGAVVVVNIAGQIGLCYNNTLDDYLIDEYDPATEFVAVFTSPEGHDYFYTSSKVVFEMEPLQ